MNMQTTTDQLVTITFRKSELDQINSLIDEATSTLVYYIKTEAIRNFFEKKVGDKTRNHILTGLIEEEHDSEHPAYREHWGPKYEWGISGLVSPIDTLRGLLLMASQRKETIS